MASPYSTLSDRVRRMLTMPKEGDFWEADHIVAVADGGGETTLDNFQVRRCRSRLCPLTSKCSAQVSLTACAGACAQTLCVPCHSKKTAVQVKESSRRKRQELAEGTADLRSFFDRCGSGSR